MKHCLFHILQNNLYCSGVILQRLVKEGAKTLHILEELQRSGGNCLGGILVVHSTNLAIMEKKRAAKRVTRSVVYSVQQVL